jgi:signal transduction histidine kinase
MAGCIYQLQIATAQNLAVIDSLQKQLRLPADTLKAKVLVDLSRELYALDPPKAIQYAKDCITLSRKIKYAWGEAMALHYLGLTAHFGGESVKAMDYYLNSLQIAEKKQLSEVIAINLSRIANINKEEGNFAESLKLHQRALAIVRKINHKLYLSYALNQMGLLHLTQKKYEAALQYFQEALTISKEIKDDRHIAICLYYSAEVYLNQGKNEKALQYYRQSYSTNKKINNLLLLASTWNNIAKIHLNTRAIDSCIIYSYKALQVARQVNLKPEIENAYRHLYKSYGDKAQIDSAFKYQTLWVAVKDSLFNEQKNKQILMLQNTYQSEKHKMEIARQKADIERSNVIIYAFLGALILLLIIAFMLYRNIRIRIKAHRKLQKRKDEITQQKAYIEQQNTHLQLLNSEIIQQKEEIAAFSNHLEDIVKNRTEELKIVIDNLSKKNEDLEQFSYIISHNLRAPVARIAGLVNIIDTNHIKDPETIGLLNHLTTTATGLDTIIKDLNQILNIRNSLDKTQEIINLEDITATILDHLQQEIESTCTEVKIDFADGREIAGIKSYVQSIIYNLVSNAIKYRSPKRKSKICIFTQDVEEHLVLTVQDQGIGIDLKNTDLYKIFGLYQRMNTHTEGKGIGLYLVKSQIEAMGGEISIESEANVGTAFKVYFPVEIEADKEKIKI